MGGDHRHNSQDHDHPSNAGGGGGGGGGAVHISQGLRSMNCCHSRTGDRGGMEISSNSAPEAVHYGSQAPPTSLKNGGGGGGTRSTGISGSTQSQDTLLRIAVPFRNNPVLKYT